jgi:hypothetical protein
VIRETRREIKESERKEITMAENNESPLDEMLKAIPELSDPDLKKLREAALEECTKRKLLITQFVESHPYESKKGRP